MEIEHDPEGIRESLRRLVGSGLQYLIVRGRLAIAESEIEIQRSVPAILWLALSLVMAVLGIGSAVLSLTLLLAAWLGSLALATGVMVPVLAALAYFMGRTGWRRFSGRIFFRTLRSEMQHDLLCLNRK